MWNAAMASEDVSDKTFFLTVYAELKKQNDELIKKNDELKQENDELKQENDELKKTVEAQGAKLCNYWQVTYDLQNDITEELNKRKASEAKYEELAERQVWLQKQYVAVTNKKCDLRDAISENIDMKKEIVVLRKRIDMLVSKNEDFKNKVMTLDCHIRRLEKTNTELNKKLRDLEMPEKDDSLSMSRKRRCEYIPSPQRTEKIV